MLVEKDVFVEDLVVDSRSRIGYFRVGDCSVRKTKRGSEFLSLKLADRTGDIEARVWDIPYGFTTRPGAYVKVEFVVEEFRDELQAKVTRIRHLLDTEETNISDFMPTTPFEVGEMWERIMDHVNRISQAELRAAVQACLKACANDFTRAPAAKGKHQACLGGLLEHTLVLVELAVSIAGVYDEVGRSTLDENILIAGAVLHDIGKIAELCYDDRIDYTLEGTLFGHITMGLAIWDKFDKDVPQPWRNHVRHIILSHHGKKEWGSPVVPMTREALVFHQIDMIDSRMGFLDGIEKTSINENNLTGFIRELDGPYWRPHGKTKQEESGTGVPQGVGESKEGDGAQASLDLEGSVDTPVVVG